MLRKFSLLAVLTLLPTIQVSASVIATVAARVRLPSGTEIVAQASIPDGKTERLSLGESYFIDLSHRSQEDGRVTYSYTVLEKTSDGFQPLHQATWDSPGHSDLIVGFLFCGPLIHFIPNSGDSLPVCEQAN